MIHRRGELGFADQRRFHFIDYRHGHGYAVVRGVPDIDEDGAALRVIDFFFAGVVRVSCGKDFGRFEIRRPSGTEMAALESRLGGFRRGESVFLLEAGTIETYIVAARVYWAEFGIAGGALSPLASEDPEYRSAHRPIGGVVLFAD